MTKIDIISGFLGAGKTTLIKKLIKEVFAGQKIVLIENEFGEIGIDGGFLKDAGINITEMNSGCICCSLVGDFGKALKQVMEQFAPDRIIIEPSGVGKLSDVRRAVEGVAEDCAITVNSLVTVADAMKVKMYMKNFGEFYNNQVESAGTIILSRTQKISEDKLDAAVALIREKNPKATIITTPWDDITGLQILGAMEKSVSLADELMAEEEVCPVCGHHHDHDHEHEHEHHHDHEDGCGHDHHEHDHEHEHHH
ncbi:MAG: GTP-binding protein, partial [Lachnospiraceae bacterium]|nr:GTP-binding protein [Lachnospiraceae bacterium]